MANSLVDVFQLYKFSTKFKEPKVFVQYVPLCSVLYKPLDVKIVFDYTYSSDILETKRDKIINYWMTLHDEEIRKFTLFVKKWFSMGPINSKINYTESLTLLIVTFLQQAGFIPSYQELKKFLDIPVGNNGKFLINLVQMRLHS